MLTFSKQARPRSVYIHWPFCPYRCHFCPFVALASHDQFMLRYNKALCSELENYRDEIGEKIPLDTIFLGGGTPSTYPDELLLDMFGTLKNIFIFDENTEVTIEVNPGTVRKEQLKVWASLGINRLSVGVQSLNDAALKKLNRLQKAEDVFFLLKHAPTYFDSISVDLILGLPGVDTNEWKKLVQTVVTWPIKHISMYFLTVHEDTPVYFKVQTNRVTLPDDDTMVDLFYWSCDTFAKHGFKQYELSNFAQEGYESRHNSVYWERKPYKAFGLGACSFDGRCRFQNEKRLMNYLELVEKGSDITMFCERLSNKQIHLEKLMLGLRRAKGVLWKTIMEDLSEEEQDTFKKNVSWLKRQKLLVERDNGTVALTPAGLVVENEVITKLSL